MSRPFEVGDLCRIKRAPGVQCFFEEGSIVQIRHVEDDTFYYTKLVLGATKPEHEDMKNNAMCFKEELEHI